jgi:Domain of unknown function (DUF6249)
MDIPSFAMFTGVITTLIFWGAVVMVILGLAVGPRYLKSRERQRMFEMMKVAYEKDQPVPPELIAALQTGDMQPTVGMPQSTSDGDLRRAVVLIFVGIGVAGLGAGFDYGISFFSPGGGAVTGGIIAGCGAIPGFIGVAYLILWLLGRNTAKA